MAVRIAESAGAIVIGGGPAGAAAARLLAANGKDVLLVERDPAYRKPCGGAIPSPVFSEFDLPARLVRNTVSTFRLVSPGGAAVDIPLREPVFVVDRPEFDAFLRSRAAEAGARMLEGDFLHAEQKREGCVCRVRLRSGEIMISADYLIAADGVNSRVRLSQKAGAVRSLLAVCERIAGLSVDACEFRFSRRVAPGFYGWIFPSGDGISIGSGCAGRGDPRPLLETLKEQAGLSGMQGRLSMFRIPVWQGELFHHGRILFAGDAAGQVMPLSYEGIYYAMKSGECAAQAVLEGRPSRYRSLWKAELGGIFSLAAKMNDFFLKTDKRAEQLVRLHQRPDVQEIAQDLWLRKRHGRTPLAGYALRIGKLFM